MSNIINTFFGIAGAIVGVVGVVLTLKSMKLNRKLKAVSWNDIQSATKHFWKSLKRSRFDPTFIVSPGQKGGIIAQMIDEFSLKQIPILNGFIETKDKPLIDNSTYLTLRTTKWNVYLPITLVNYDKKSEAKILIVDDFVMSGDFLFKLKNKLISLGYLEENIKSCAIAVTKVAIDADKGPDYFWKIVDNKDFDFPWGKAK